MSDLDTVIEDSITDLEIPETPDVDPTPTEPVEAAPETTSEPTEPVKDTPPVEEVDPFDKKWGLTQNASSGRENRIPYSRVKKIVEKAQKEAESARNDFYKGYAEPTKLKEYEDKVKDYETRLSQVSEFEKIMTQDHGRFLTMLHDRVPGYAQILAPLFAPQDGGSTQPPPSTFSSADMPQPDQTLSDGSKVYSMEGLQKLMEWQAAQVEAKVTKQVEDRVTGRYKAIEDTFNQHQRVQAILPKVQAQIEEARKWPLFNESEAEIVEALRTNPAWNLERAYNAVVVPKLQADRNKMKEDVLKEIKSAPKSTSVPSTSVKAAPTTSKGPRKLEDVIADSIKGLPK